MQTSSGESEPVNHGLVKKSDAKTEKKLSPNKHRDEIKVGNYLCAVFISVLLIMVEFSYFSVFVDRNLKIFHRKIKTRSSHRLVGIY